MQKQKATEKMNPLPYCVVTSKAETQTYELKDMWELHNSALYIANKPLLKSPMRCVSIISHEIPLIQSQVFITLTNKINHLSAIAMCDNIIVTNTHMHVL